MKKYLLFAGFAFYPSGGMADFEGHFDTVQDAQDHLKAEDVPYDWWQIVEHATMKIVLEN